MVCWPVAHTCSDDIQTFFCWVILLLKPRFFSLGQSCFFFGIKVLESLNFIFSNHFFLFELTNKVLIFFVNIEAILLEGLHRFWLPLGVWRHNVGDVKTHVYVLIIINILKLLDNFFIFATLKLVIGCFTTFFGPEKESVNPVLANPTLFVRFQHFPLTTERNIGFMT